MAQTDPRLQARLDGLEAYGRDPLTVYNNLVCLRRFDAWMAEHALTFMTIERDEFEDFLVGLRHQGLAPSTIRANRTMIRAAVHYHQKRQRRGQEPIFDFTLTAEVPQDDAQAMPDDFSAQELRAIYQAIRNPREEIVFHILAYAGLRRCEVCKLLWQQIDFDRVFIDLYGRGASEGAIAKMGKPRRVPIHPILCDVLIRHFNHAHGRYVLPSQKGPHYTCRGLQALVDRLLRRAGVKGGPQKFRRTFNSSMMDNGAQERLAEVVMGHAPKSVNRRHYQAINWRKLVETVNLVYADAPIEERAPTLKAV